MKLTEHQSRIRLAAADHGVLCTVHHTRGVDAVPIVYASDDERIGVPVDLVKDKSPGRLQRERNLGADPRATLLVDHWDRSDWSQLWWVRAELRWVDDPGIDVVEDLEALLAGRYEQYRDRPFARILVFRVLAAVGWSATEP